MIAFGLSGRYEMVAIIAAFVAVAIAGTIQGARTYLTARIAEAAGDAERSRKLRSLGTD